MAFVLTVLRALVPLLLASAEDGTLVEIVATGLKLIGLVKPLLSDPKAMAAAEAFAGTLTASAPAQPEDPVFARQGRSKFGGR